MFNSFDVLLKVGILVQFGPSPIQSCMDTETRPADKLSELARAIDRYSFVCHPYHKYDQL